MSCPPPYFLLFVLSGLKMTEIFKTKCLYKGQATTCNSLFEQKLRQIIPVLFCLPEGHWFLLSCLVSLLVPPHAAPGSLVFSRSYSHGPVPLSPLSPHSALSLDLLIFTLFLLSCVSFFFLFQVFGSIPQSSTGVSENVTGNYLPKDTNEKQKHWVLTEAGIYPPGCHGTFTRYKIHPEKYQNIIIFEIYLNLASNQILWKLVLIKK